MRLVVSSGVTSSATGRDPAEFYPAATTDGPRTGREEGGVREVPTQWHVSLSLSLSLPLFCHSLILMEVKTRPVSALICCSVALDKRAREHDEL